MNITEMSNQTLVAAIILASLRLCLCLAGISAASAWGAELPSRQVLLQNAISVDPEQNVVVLPIHRGYARGSVVWYIMTESSDPKEAAERKVIYAPILAAASPVQRVRREGRGLVFQGAPNFGPTRRFVRGPAGFPPNMAEPGAIGDAAYSPFIRIGTDPAVLNAPIIATGEGPFDTTTHQNTADRVLRVDASGRTVTLLLSHGFAEGREVVYISTEASDPVAAALERATYVPHVGGNAAIAIIAFKNGQTGRDNPDAQGLSYAAIDGLLEREATLTNARDITAARNVMSALPFGPRATDYSPIWDVVFAVWSRAAVASKLNTAQTSTRDIYRLASEHLVALSSSGILVNCPIIGLVSPP